MFMINDVSAFVSDILVAHKTHYHHHQHHNVAAAISSPLFLFCYVLYSFSIDFCFKDWLTPSKYCHIICNLINGS